LQQNTKQEGEIADNEDAKSKADKPKSGSKRRGGFKKNGDAKQYLDELGPDTVEQILLNAGYLNKPTLEEAKAALDSLLSTSNDMVSAAAAFHTC
jgi:hypothetical protein